MTRTYNAAPFFARFFGIQPVEPILTPAARKHRVTMNPKDMEKYPPIITDVRPWEVLRYACRYAIRQDVIRIFDMAADEPADEPMRGDRWLFYAARSPIWANRIAEKGGVVDTAACRVVFSNPDQEESFYDSWGYEPDEQPVEVQMKWQGTVIMSFTDFAKKCGVEFRTNDWRPFEEPIQPFSRIE